MLIAPIPRLWSRICKVMSGSMASYRKRFTSPISIVVVTPVEARRQIVNGEKCQWG
jgi:hypothetical protein